MAVSALMRPAPWRAMGSSRLVSPSAPVQGTGLAVERRRQATWSKASRPAASLISGCACMMRAATPATYGDAIEVPAAVRYGPPRSIGQVDQILPPGATTSGLVWRDSLSPQEEKEETSPAVARSNSATFSVKVSVESEVSPPRMESPSAWEMVATGMVICSPSP